MQNNRLVTYVGDEVAKWVAKEAKKLGMNESTFLRFVLLQFKQSSK